MAIGIIPTLVLPNHMLMLFFQKSFHLVKINDLKNMERLLLLLVKSMEIFKFLILTQLKCMI